MNLTLLEFLHYAEEEQARWHEWFRKNGDDALRIPYPGDLHTSVDAALKHSFGSELWFAETIGGTPLTDWWSDPPDSYERLFTHGTRAKALIGLILERFTPEDWSRAVELKSPQVTLKVTARKALANALMHEIRHWAQVAVLVRQHGIAPPGSADLILSGALD